MAKVSQEFKSHDWRERRQKVMHGRQTRAYWLGVQARPVGQPVVEILRVMKENPERFEVTRQNYGSSLTEYTVKDRENRFFYVVGVSNETYKSPDDFDEYFHFISQRWTENLEWANIQEVQALGLGTLDLVNAQHMIAVKFERETKEARIRDGREKTMKLYGLEG